jgi:hypothetical protein
MRLTKKDADLAITAKLQKKTKDEKKENRCQFHENMTNEARRDACKKDCSTSNRKSSHQAVKRIAKKHQYYFR